MATTLVSLCVLAGGLLFASAPALAVPPKVEEVYVSDVGSGSATLSATVNPEGAATTYMFEYAPAGGAFTPVPASAGKESITEGTAGVLVSVHVQQGLLPHTSYEFRLVASNSVETVTGEPVSFTTQTPGGELVLPDSRAWEMVSPPGNAIAYPATAATEAQPQGSPSFVEVLSTRGSGGWGSRDIAIPHNVATGAIQGQGQEYRFFTSDLSLSIVQPFHPFPPPSSPASLSAEASESTAYLRTDYLNGNASEPCTSSCYRPLVTGKPGYANVPPGTVFGEESGGECTVVVSRAACGPFFVGATPDLSHVVVESNVALISTSNPRESLYEWAGGTLTFIGSKARFHAIDDGGSRVVFDGESEGLNGLLMRDLTAKKTLKLDVAEPECLKEGKCESGGGSFQIASHDGLQVFFTSAQRLTKDSGASTEVGHQASDLYVYDLTAPEGQRVKDLTPLGGGEEHANVQGRVSASEDGSSVYFVAGGVLTQAENGQKEKAQTGTCEGESTCNLYLHHNGVTKLVAVLSAEDAPDWTARLDQLTARVSPNGEWLVFMSQRSLTGYDNHDAVSGLPDEEVYLYNAGTGSLVCASCNPTGARPAGVELGQEVRLAVGESGWMPQRWLAANVRGWTPYTLGFALYQSRYLSDSGRLFFNSSDALVPQDVNRTEDVYQYEPPGVGDCTTASVTFSQRSGGCVGLISSGTSAEESAFLDASESGGDVFFLTAAKLAQQDTDTSLDVYDAHECTQQSLCLAQPLVTPPSCSTGDSCKPSPSLQPSIFGSPASATFSGAGNLPPAVSKPAVKPRSLTRTRKLAKALKACRAKHNKHMQASCEAQARKRYGSQSKSASHKGGK
jgi:hypothetical protein